MDNSVTKFCRQFFRTYCSDESEDIRDKVISIISDIHTGDICSRDDTSLQLTLYYGWKEISDLPWAQRQNFYHLALDYTFDVASILPHRRCKSMMENILLGISTGLFLDERCGDISRVQPKLQEETNKVKTRR